MAHSTKKTHHEGGVTVTVNQSPNQSPEGLKQLALEFLKFPRMNSYIENESDDDESNIKNVVLIPGRRQYYVATLWLRSRKYVIAYGRDYQFHDLRRFVDACNYRWWGYRKKNRSKFDATQFNHAITSVRADLENWEHEQEPQTCFLSLIDDIEEYLLSIGVFQTEEARLKDENDRAAARIERAKQNPHAAKNRRSRSGEAISKLHARMDLFQLGIDEFKQELRDSVEATIRRVLVEVLSPQPVNPKPETSTTTTIPQTNTLDTPTGCAIVTTSES